MTNMLGADKLLWIRCDRGHRHVELLSGRAKAAQVYPQKLCRAFLESLKLHMKLEENITLEALEDADDVDPDGHEQPQTIDAILDLSGEPQGEWKDTLHQEYDHYHDYNFFDEVTGKPLDSEKVKKGEQLEMEKFKSRRVYECVPRNEVGNGKLIKTRWVRVKKGEEVRCRLVAQEFATGDPRDDLFASTPPLFSARWIVSMAATRRRRPWTLMCLDVSCAFLYALVVRDLFIEIPQADPRSHDHNLVGRLRKALYGTRDAPQLWQRTLGKVLRELGFSSSKLQPGVFRHKERDIIMVTHVDDFLVAGPPEELEWVRGKLREHFEVNGQMIGERDSKNCSIVKQVKFLGRTIRREADGFTWEADTKHVRILLEESGMEDCKSLSLPLAREDEQLDDNNMEEKEMNIDQAKQFRRAVARLNYLALDRPDIAVAVNRLARCMAKPLVLDDLPLKRVLRYLKGRPRCQMISAYRIQSRSWWPYRTATGQVAGEPENRLLVSPSFMDTIFSPLRVRCKRPRHCQVQRRSWWRRVEPSQKP